MNTYKTIRSGKTHFVVASSKNAASQKLIGLDWKLAVELAQIERIAKI